MTQHTMRPAVASLGLLALLSLTACTDPNALGAIPSDASIDTITEPTPTETPDDWFSAPVTEEPDWDGMSLGQLEINGDQYSYLEVEGEEPRYRNVSLVPFEVGDTEPQIDPNGTFYVEFKSDCRTTWTHPDEREPSKEGVVAPPEVSMFIAESENAVDGVPVPCTTDNLNYEGQANSWAWFTPKQFSDGNYFIITVVKDSSWRQVVPFTIEPGILEKQGLGLEENGIWHDPRAVALPGEQAQIYWWELSKTKPTNDGGQWWVEPKREDFFKLSEAALAGSGTDADPITGSFVVLLRGEHRSARANTWVLGRDEAADSGPELSCAPEQIEDSSGYSTKYTCGIWPFVDSKGKAGVYHLILTSQPGNVRQVFEVSVK